ncbi:MAG: glycosyltransferase family 2 protein [Campylobacterales bacterium]|nr:glycosyltransferase family 2 protein [Campylobacterales bacterium]
MITVLTPTYNRAHTLERLFESLLLQNVPFEWLVIDDGSRDGTGELIERLSLSAPFPIRYLWQENSGKHVAVNTGVRLAEGEWIFIVDSDDVLTGEALQIVQDTAAELPPTVLGFVYRRMYPDRKLIGAQIDQDAPLKLTPTQAATLLKGDLAYVFRTETLWQNPFPVIAGETFVPELYLWNRISDQGEIFYYPSKAIYITEYLDDGYSKNFKSNLKRNPRGFALFYRDQFFRETSPLRKLKTAIRYLQCLMYEVLR